MLVFSVSAEALGDGFVVRSPEVPALEHRVGSVWEACSVRPVIAGLKGVPEDLVWLQIRSLVAAVSVVSTVHPSHRAAFHTLTRPAHPAFDRTPVLFELALDALRHETDQQAGAGARAEFLLSFLDGRKAQLPGIGGYDPAEVIDAVGAGGDFSAWLRDRISGRRAAAPEWRIPVVALQLGVLRPELAGALRYR